MRYGRQVRRAIAGTRRAQRDDAMTTKDTRRREPFAAIENAVEAIRAGRMVVVVDDEGRENEGDLTMAAAKVTPEAINFMARHGRGLICLAMTPERLDQLSICLLYTSPS